MRRLAGILLLVSGSLVFGAETKPPIVGCQAGPGWRCIETKELADDARYKIDLEERIALAEARLKARRLFGWHFGAGIGIGAVPTADFDVKAVPVGFVGAVYGW